MLNRSYQLSLMSILEYKEEQNEISSIVISAIKLRLMLHNFFLLANFILHCCSISLKN